MTMVPVPPQEELVLKNTRPTSCGAHQAGDFSAEANIAEQVAQLNKKMELLMETFTRTQQVLWSCLYQCQLPSHHTL